MEQRKPLIYLAAALVVLIAAYAGYQGYMSAGSGSLELSTVPNDADIRVGKGATVKAGKIRVDPGKHVVTVERKDFVTRTFTLEIKKGQTIKRQFALQPANADGRRFLTSNPDQVAEGEAITGQEIRANADEIAKDPIIGRLPYKGSNFRIDSGKSVKNAGKDAAFALYIQCYAGPASKQRALDWMASQGYDPAKYEIIYDSICETRPAEQMR